MDYSSERKALVSSLVDEGYLKSKNVIDAMLNVPRELFVPESLMMSAYDDCPLPIGDGQTISAPHMVALMTESLKVEEDSVILEVGAGSGYQAAVLAFLARTGFIYSLERVPSLVEFARKNLASCGVKNVEVIHSDGTLGYERHALYNRIIVTAAAPRVPKALIAQLKDGGLMLVPVGNRFLQNLVEVRKNGDEIKETSHGGCVFVPLIGHDGWN